MPYVIDASSLIEAKDRYYGFDFCPGYWDWLLRENARGVVFSIDKVGRELEAGNDDLAVWAKANAANFFLPVDQPTLTAMPHIVTWINGANFRPQAVPPFLAGADPFLIAFALVGGHTVVTDEVFVPGERRSVKIPAVCQQFNVACIDPFEMLRREGARLILHP